MKQLSKSQSINIAYEYSFLIGNRFTHPKYGVCFIDVIQPVEFENGYYGIELIYETQKRTDHLGQRFMGSEMSPTIYYKYHKVNASPYNQQKYGLL